MIRAVCLFFSLIFLSQIVVADEGMWLPNQLKQTCATRMAEAGCKLPPEALYSEDAASLKDAVVRFGNGCTGEVVSADGLLLTNHHCGYEYVQALSTVADDYLQNGFAAKSRSEELPCPGLTVRFLQYMEDVSAQILTGTPLPDDLQLREDTIRQRYQKLIDARKTKDASLDYEIKPLYYGNQYMLYAYLTFRDVRLVVAPPSSIGKFGGDTDNWMWPRHTGDFTLFRIYSDAQNTPAAYSASNVPYHPKKFLKINTSGAQEGDFVMVYGYPGRTQQYLTAAAVASIAKEEDPRRVALRRERLDVMEQFMNANDTLRLKYAAKHVNVANAWKKWIGESQGLDRLAAVEQKTIQEKAFGDFVQSTPELQREYGNVLPTLNSLQAQMRPLLKSNDYYTQNLIGIESLAFALRVVRQTEKARTEQRDLNKEELKTLQTTGEEFFKDYDLRVDLALAQKILTTYLRDNTPQERLQSLNAQVSDAKQIERFQQKIMQRSIFTQAKTWEKTLADAHIMKRFQKDPLYTLALNVSAEHKEKIQVPLRAIQQQTEALYGRYIKGLQEWDASRVFFPDANSTLRLAFGKVEGYTPREGVRYMPFTTLDGLLEKVKLGAHDYILSPRLAELIARKDYGQWAVNGQVPACFIASVHTTGGNSGSPVLNARGELLGLNFDRVWEGTMSDVMFDPERCRNITVDIRYVLFVIEKYFNAAYLFEELQMTNER